MNTSLPAIGRDDILTTVQVAELINVPVATLRYWRFLRNATNPGPKSFTLGARKVAYLRADVDAWLAEQYGATPAHLRVVSA